MAVAARKMATKEDLIDAIERALWSYPPVRSRDLPLDVEVSEGGRVTMEGHAPSRTIKEGVLGVVGSVLGVSEVVDQMHADPDLELATAKALTETERTKHILPGTVQIFAQLGVVVLVGKVPSAADREAIVGVAREVEGVRDVVDRMSA